MEAYITLLTNNNYASGALVLAHSLRAAQTTKQLAVLITASVSRPIREKLALVFDSLIEIGEIDSHSTSNLALLGRPELGITLTKIHIFNQTQYSKVVFLDADTLVLRNIDDLFETAANGTLEDEDRNKRFAASPDAGWPDCFNSGVFVCKPCYKDYTGLIQMASQEGTFDGGDQGLLNSYFSGWSRGEASNRLPFTYNTTPTASYSYAPAYQQYRDRLAVVHFIGNFKPWQWLRFADGKVFPRNTSSKDSIDLVQQWWNVFDNFVGGKPSDIHDVVHGYDLPPVSQWDHVGFDGQPHGPEAEKKPHYDGWFKAYDHQNQAQQPPKEGHPEEWQPPIPPRLGERIEWLHEHQHHEHQHHEHQHRQHQHHEHQHQQQQHQEHHHNEHHEYHHHDGHHEHHHHNGHHEHHHHHHHHHHNENHEHEHKHHHEHHDHNEQHRHEHNAHHEHHEHHEEHHHQDPGVPRPPTRHETHYAYNPHHMTDYHYQPPPLPPVIPLLPEPESHSWRPNDTATHVDEQQAHDKRTPSSTSIIDREINPHHLTDYRYRLPPVIDSSDVTNVAAKFGAIIPEPVGLPDMYYPNAWDLPEDPRKAHPTLEVTPLLIEDTTNKDNTSVPSGKGRRIFPWEANGSVSSTPRTPTRKYYNYAASAEEQKRLHDLEVTKRLEAEEKALKQIRLQEQARYERERLKEEAQEQVTGSQAFENFRLVNAWDVDVGVQMSILQRTEKRRPRSRKSSAGGFRKGYGLEDMLVYEARQRQEQYEAELIQQRLDEEERWQKEQEEARIKEEELRLEKVRLAKIAKIRAAERLRKQEESSAYVFRNAWDPPNIGVTKKKLRIEDEDIEFALPLRQNRRSEMTFGYGSSTGVSEREEAVARAGSAAAVLASGAAAAGGIALAARSGAVQVQGKSEPVKSTEISERATRSASGAAIIKLEAATLSSATDSSATKDTKTITSSTSTTTEGTSATRTTDQGAVCSTTTKITAPGTHRFVRTTVTTTITRRKFANGVEVSSATTSSTTGGEKMFEIPAGPRSGHYFTGPGRRTVSLASSQEASRLTGTTTTRATGSTTTRATDSTTSTTTTANKTSTQQAITSGHTSESKTTHTEEHAAKLTEGQKSTLTGQESAYGSQVITSVQAPTIVYQADQQVTTAAATTSDTTKTTATTTSSKTIVQGSGHSAISGTTTSSFSSHFGTSGSSFKSEVVEEPRKLTGLALQINTGSPSKERRVEEEWALEIEERQRINDLREKNASAAAAAEAMQVLDRYPQATDRYAARRRADSTSSTKSIGGGALYANDPHAHSSSASSSAFRSTAREKSIKTTAYRSQDVSSDEAEDNNVYQEDLDELEYFGMRHTRGALPLGSPYMPSTPLAASSHRYAASASGFSSRAGSRPTTPGPSTPSRFGPGTPNLLSKRAFELKQGTIKGLQQSQPQSEQQQSAMGDFSNYRIEWNWKELLGKKPRHWSAESGEEYYDPYSALSTHGSLIDSDEDDHHIVDSSEEDSEEEEQEALREQQKRSRGVEGSAGFSQSSSSSSTRGSGAFATGADNDFTRESEFVIRGGKIARRRSSMVLDRELLQS
ncbi:hypothetical protein BGW39_001691 [Mortierella sp. 14UC]|nr:hypothetical protein BGW39_001691 [Mortierella sp. 14UC]